MKDAVLKMSTKLNTYMLDIRINLSWKKRHIDAYKVMDCCGNMHHDIWATYIYMLIQAILSV